MTFHPLPSGVEWRTDAGPYALSTERAQALLTLWRDEHDRCLRAGDRMAARDLRKLVLDLEDALPKAEPALDLRGDVDGFCLYVAGRPEGVFASFTEAASALRSARAMLGETLARKVA